MKNYILKIISENGVVISRRITKTYFEKNHNSTYQLICKKFDNTNIEFNEMLYLLLNDIEKAMFEIMKDGKIDSNDIPYLITIIQKLYEFMFSLKIEKLSTEKRSAICAEIIKFIVHVLIKERRIKVDPSKQDAFLSQFNALMDSCVSLLSLQSTLLSSGCCSCFFSKK